VVCRAKRSHQDKRMKMRPNNNIAVVQRLYQARGNATVIREVVDRNVCWEVVAGFPYSDVYVGLDDVLGRFFARLFADFEDWHTEPEEFFEVDNRVIALGTYSARAKTTSKTFQARFAHVWTIRDGVIVRLQHCADTAQIAKALGKDFNKE
jgi:ketosteroid isomerase-like protein